MNDSDGDSTRLILPFAAIDRDALPMAGGKAVNLGELVRTGFPVPPGFCVTTAAYDMVATDAGIESTLAALAAADAGDTERLAGLAEEARSGLTGASVPDVLRLAIEEAYGELGGGEYGGEAIRVAVGDDRGELRRVQDQAGGGRQLGLPPREGDGAVLHERRLQVRERIAVGDAVLGEDGVGQPAVHGEVDRPGADAGH